MQKCGKIKNFSKNVTRLNISLKLSSDLSKRAEEEIPRGDEADPEQEAQFSLDSLDIIKVSQKLSQYFIRVPKKLS